MPWLRREGDILPKTLVAAVTELPRAAVTMTLGNVLLIVKLEDPEGNLGKLLHECTQVAVAPPKTTRSSTKVSPKWLESRHPRAPPPSLGPRALERRLRAATHFVIPLSQWAAQLHSDRISIGRARARDLVLYNHSVSSFHAWLNHDESGNYFLTANGSTNGTHLNEEKLTPHRFVDIRAGDSIAFGDVETFVCRSETFWDVVAAKASRNR